MILRFLRLLPCILSFRLIHWSGQSDGGGMGDAIQCDHCKCDHYGPGAIIFDRADDKSMADRANAWTLVFALYALAVFVVGFVLLSVYGWSTK